MTVPVSKRLLFSSLVMAVALSASSLLPHHEEVAPGVHAVGFAHAHGSANSGWIELRDSIVLVDLPRGISFEDYLTEASKAGGKTAQRLVRTSYREGDEEIV